jgi:hypothetical protein
MECSFGSSQCPALEGSNVRSGHYEVIRKENESRLLWLESAEDLESAKSRIQELASFWQGEFQVLDRDSYQIVAATDRVAVNRDK